VLVTSLLLSFLIVAQRPGCAETHTPAQLPAVGLLIDSAQALADLGSIKHASRPMVFSLLFNEDDSFPRVHPLDNSDAIAGVLLMHWLRPQPPAEIWAVRLRIVEDSSPALTLERSVYCPPVPGPDPQLDVVMSTVVGVPAGTPPPRSPPAGKAVIKLEALISESGRVSVVRLTQPSGVAEIDDAVLKSWRVRQFEPALIDGRPMQAVYRTNGESPRL
jgi:Gram-negative bacterial TonB protein C-terminal